VSLRFRVLAGLLLASGAAACSARSAGKAAHETTVHRYVFGLFGGKAVDVRDVCASGDARHIRVRRPFWVHAASAATLGLYLPHRLRIECQEPTWR
jgi:hypothetical protein